MKNNPVNLELTVTNHVLYMTGSAHELIPVKALVARLLEAISEQKVVIFDKEEHLLAMSKQLPEIVSEWDAQTELLVQKLHQARDEQVCR